jgi:hypothetical protein
MAMEDRRFCGGFNMSSNHKIEYQLFPPDRIFWNLSGADMVHLENLIQWIAAYQPWMYYCNAPWDLYETMTKRKVITSIWNQTRGLNTMEKCYEHDLRLLQGLLNQFFTKKEKKAKKTSKV